MDKQIENPATRELRSMIRFLNVRNTKSADDIHHQICEVCGENAMNDSTVRRWMRLLKNCVAQYRINDEACLAVWLGFYPRQCSSANSEHVTQQLLIDFDWEQLDYDPLQTRPGT